MTEGPDLVVAGAGGGLAGALRAASLGLSVLVVEKNEHFAVANNTAMSTAMIPGAGSRWQRSLGIDDSPQTFVADMVAKTHGEVDRDLAIALAGVSARLVEWLADEAGLPMSLVTDFPYPGHSQYRCHTVPGRTGRALLRDLLGRVRESDLIDVMVPARLVSVTSDASGVTGVVVDTPSGQEEIPTGAVLLATNGFGADAAMVREHIPEIAGAVYHGSEGSTGDGLRIGCAMGGATAFLDAYQGHAALAMPAATLTGWATVMHGGFLVAADGRRFGDESTGYSEYAAEVLAHAAGQAWIIFDERIHQACQGFQDYQDTVASGAVRWADDIASLADAVGVDAGGLARTFAGATSVAMGEATDQFGRTHWEERLKAPFAAVAVRPALFHTQGGLVVDGHARVLDGADAAITGLYASGGAAAGISGHGARGYLAGNGLLPAFGLALLAAEHVAGLRDITLER